MAGDGFTVRAGALAAGGKDIAGLLGLCEKAGSDAVADMAAMGEAACGNAGLAAALLAAAEAGTKAFLDIGAAYRHTGASLDATAGTYARAEDENVGRASGLGGGAIGGRAR